MTRDIDAILKDGLANQKGESFFRVLSWLDQDAYDANPNTPDNTWQCKAFSIKNTKGSATLVSGNDYTISNFSVFIIERGLKIAGIEYPIQSGLFFVESYKETYGYIFITGSSFPNIKIELTNGDGTYEEVIDYFATAIGKTARHRKEDQAYLNYQFFKTGKTLKLNKSSQFETLVNQKHCLQIYEEEPGSLVFYNLDSSTRNNADWNGIAYSPELGLFATCAFDKISYSTDGRFWVSTNSPITTFGVDWSDITWSPELNLFCGVGIGEDEHTGMTSPDGINWTLRTLSSQEEWRAITWSSDLSIFCAVSGSGTISTSSDGINWTQRFFDNTKIFSDIEWSPELSLFCAVGTSPSIIYTSPDGTNWTSRTPAEANSLSSVTWSSSLSLFCLVSTNGTNRVQTSPDGINWTVRTAAEANQWNSIMWSPTLSLFFAVSIDGTNRGMSSPDGFTWTAKALPLITTYNKIIWATGIDLFVCVSENNTILSDDGTNWDIGSLDVDWAFSYTDGPKSFIRREQSEIHWSFTDETGTKGTSGDTTKPQWNIGFKKIGDGVPQTSVDPYYKFYLQKAPVRLDITDGDKIAFSPYWSIDPAETIEAPVTVIEVFDTDKSPSWYQEIESIALFFGKTEGGSLPVLTQKSGAYTPINSTGFDNNLKPDVKTLQALAEAVDDLPPTGGENNPPDVTQAEAEAGTGSANRTWTPLRVAQAIAALETGGGNGGKYQRSLAADLAIDDGEALVTSQYLDANDYNLTLSGDASLEIL